MSLRKRMASASFGRRARQLGQVARHPIRHWRTLRLVESARREGLATADAAIGWKYLGEYLAGALSTSERVRLITSHYRYLRDRLPDSALRRRWASGVCLWERRAGDAHYAVRLSQADFCPLEGEAQLCLFRNAAQLFTLTFALVDGGTLGLGDGQTMFIGGMQGGYACQQANRAAARDNGEIAPAAMLVLAARAVAEALGVARIVAVSSDRQAAAAYAGDKIRFRYDDYWQQLGARRLGNGLFLLDPPAAGQRNLDHLSPPHRKRALRKARLKAELAAAMLGTLEEWLGEPAIARPATAAARPGWALPKLGWALQPA